MTVIVMDALMVTSCDGPKSCKFYKAGPARQVLERRGMRWMEEDWGNEEMTAHRTEDE